MLRKLYEKAIQILGDIKIYRYPFFLVYDPSSFGVRGCDLRFLQDRLQPGDILLRKYESYLDDRFIPGWFTHAGLYLGPVSEADIASVPPEHSEKLRIGPQMVIHSMAEGVFLEDFLDFSRCDYLFVLRMPSLQNRFPTLPPATGMSSAEQDFDARLRAGETIPWEEAWPVVRTKALGRLGARYDFQFDFGNYNDVSCTEFVHYAYKSLQCAHGIAPKVKSVAFLRRILITPDGFCQGALEGVGCSATVSAPRQDKRPRWLRERKDLHSCLG